MSKPPLAPIDQLTRRIQKVLDLIRPALPDDDRPRFDGYCGAATEAYLHLSGERPPTLRVQRGDNGDGTSHWWLVHSERGVIDVTLTAAERRNGFDGYPYEHGRGASFRNGYATPSRRAQVIIDLVRAQT